MFRSLAVKLTLAFLGVGIVTFLIVALIVGAQTRRDFNTYVRDRFEQTLKTDLERYYRANGSWADLATIIALPDTQPLNGTGLPQAGNRQGQGQGPGPGQGAARPQLLIEGDQFTMRIPFTIVGADNRVIFSANAAEGSEVPASEMRRGIPLQVGGEPVGTLLVALRPPEQFQYDPNEASFLSRQWRTIALGALAALIFGIAMSTILARTLTRPILSLTDATRDIARGNLGRQVVVTSKDELGDLGSAFNQMSTDLAQSVNLRKQMTADIAHDLRTPLSVILGYTEALDDGVLPPSPETYSILHDEAKHLSRLVDDLRTLSLAEAGELRLDRYPTAPADLLARAAAAHRVQADQQGVAIVTQADDNLPEIDVDAERMAQVLHNLVGNALRYTPAGGTITLSAHVAGANVEIGVADTGSGIDSAHLPMVFERFYRADAARQQSGESGLGLPIAKSLVEMHGGTINVTSEQGQGATFTIRIPIDLKTA